MSSDSETSESENEQRDTPTTWKDLGLIDSLCTACKNLNWKTPTKIQCEAIPIALKGRDIIALAETGSGKTAAFALPIVQALIDKPHPFFALILTPTRELADQISSQINQLTSELGVKTVVVVGGMDKSKEEAALMRKPHIVVATPGRLLDHLKNSKKFHMRYLKYLVLDEADRILSLPLDSTLDGIFNMISEERCTMLFSATMTTKVKELQRVSLRDPVKLEITNEHQTVSKLKQHYIFMPHMHKDLYLVYILNKIVGQTTIVFCKTWRYTMRVVYMLRHLNIKAVPLHGQMDQRKRLLSLEKFRKKTETQILVATDVASRGLDIPKVDVVINFDFALGSRDYIHRVGRTARAGLSGVAISFVTQYEIELCQRLEHFLGKRLELYEDVQKDDVLALKADVETANFQAKQQLKDFDKGKKEKLKRKGKTAQTPRSKRKKAD